MAFQAPITGQERQNRKILEQLEEQKKRLRIQTQPGPATSAPASATAGSASFPWTPNAPATQPTATGGTSPMVLPETQPMNPAQRTALQHANANSFGYFITQDSSFGNLILPVLPRFADASPAKT